MSELAKTTTGRLSANAGKISTTVGFQALSDVVNAAQQCITIHNEERTKQERIHTYAQIEIRRVKAAEETLQRYFEQVFTERRTNFDLLFERLDSSLTEGNRQATEQILTTILAVARDSPLKDLGNLEQIRVALDDPDQVWDL